jgi:hypothetical protein
MPTVAISIILGIVWLLNRISRPNWLVWTIGVLQIVSVAVLFGAGLVNIVVNGLYFLSSWLPFVLIICLIMTWGPRPQVRLHRLVGPILLVGLLVYTGSVLRERVEDQKYAWFTERDLSRADRVRAAMP